MVDVDALPPAWRRRAFTSAEAAAAGVTRRMLQGSTFVKVHRGVHRLASCEPTLDVLTGADLLLLPGDAHLSHVTGLQWWGVDLGETAPRHYSTNTSSQTQLKNVILHRRQHRLRGTTHRGRPVLCIPRLLVDSATIVPPAHVVRAADQLVSAGLIGQFELGDFSWDEHLDGVVKARRAARHVRDRVDSFKETDLRLLLVACGLPEPEVNVAIHDRHGTFLARGDLVYDELQVLVEYDGRHHLEADQRVKDLERREALEAAGWIVIVITAEHLASPAAVIRRVTTALRSRGYQGTPVFNPSGWKNLRNV